MPQARSGTKITIPPKLTLALQEEQNRLGRLSNPAPPKWDVFISVVLSLGLERLKTMSDAKALTLLKGPVWLEPSDPR